MHLPPMNMELTPQEKTQLLPLHAQSCDKRNCNRIKAVIHASDGWSAPWIVLHY